MLGGAIDRLIQANLTLWHKEDERRDRSLNDSERLQAADEVSLWNQRRNQAIDEINTLLASEVAPDLDSDSAILLTGTLGDLIDRLSIARIRYFHLQKDSGAEKDTRLPKVAEEIEDLRTQIDQALSIASSLSEKDRQRLFGFGKNKSYTDEK